MGEIELNREYKICSLFANLIIYGAKATEELAAIMQEEMHDIFNQPQHKVIVKGVSYTFQVIANVLYKPTLTKLEVLENTNPRNNYFRIEAYSMHNISFVDGVGSNTGYFLIDNLYVGSTTTAHEFGHTIGLDHPTNLDHRGKGHPLLMQPRGTWVDPQFQYDPKKAAGELPGGTMHPAHRRWHQSEVDLLRIDRLDFKGNKAVIGDFSSVWHEAHIP
jgi:hypothetical protein